MNILQKYYESKLALDILTQEVEEQKAAVTEYLLTLPERKASIPGMNFSLTRNFEYEFTEKAVLIEQNTKKITDELKKKVTEAQNAIKRIKAIEIEEGLAKLISTTYTLVAPIKKVKGGEK